MWTRADGRGVRQYILESTGGEREGEGSDQLACTVGPSQGANVTSFSSCNQPWRRTGAAGNPLPPTPAPESEEDEARTNAFNLATLVQCPRHPQLCL